MVMSAILDSLLAEIGDPAGKDLLAVTVPRVQARIQQLTKRRQLELRDEVAEIRRTLAHEAPAWEQHQIIFQCLWHLNHVDDELDKDQQTLRSKIDRDYQERNGNWYAAGTWLTPEEVGERIKRRTAELLGEGHSDAG